MFRPFGRLASSQTSEAFAFDSLGDCPSLKVNTNQASSHSFLKLLNTGLEDVSLLIKDKTMRA